MRYIFTLAQITDKVIESINSQKIYAVYATYTFNSSTVLQSYPTCLLGVM